MREYEKVQSAECGVINILVGTDVLGGPRKQTHIANKNGRSVNRPYGEY